MEAIDGRTDLRSRRSPVAFVDSSAIVTLVDADDASHTAAVEAYQSLVDDGYRLFTTNHVLDEAFELLTVGVGAAVARQWLRDNRLPIYFVDETDLAAATKLIAARGGKLADHADRCTQYGRDGAAERGRCVRGRSRVPRRAELNRAAVTEPLRPVRPEECE